MPSIPPFFIPLIAVLQEARQYLTRPDNDFAWSSWEDAPAALREIDSLIATVQSGALPDPLTLRVLFTVTGPIQEVSLSSGWAQEFLDIAARFDSALDQAQNARRSQ